MKLTLLEIVQDMLTAIDSENVTAVGDTEESGMCVNLANRAFESMIVRHRWRHTRQFTKLESTTNINELKPHTGTIALDPDQVWYDEVRIRYLYPEDFLYHTETRDLTEANVVELSNLKIRTDQPPTWYTSDDDVTLKFDAYEGSGLDFSLSKVLTYNGPTSRLTQDEEIFDLPYQAFPALSDLCDSFALRYLKADTQAAETLLRDHKGKMSTMGLRGKLIDKQPDSKRYLTARSTRRGFFQPVLTGPGNTVP